MSKEEKQEKPTIDEEAAVTPATPGPATPLMDQPDSAKSEASIMESILGLLRIRVKQGINLAVRDVRSSDPYCVFKMGTQKLKTKIIRNDVNPKWNEDLTLSIMDPELPIVLKVFDYDTFSKDDLMGDAEFDITDFLEALKRDHGNVEEGTVVRKVLPSRNNCLAEESCIVWREGKLVQDLFIRLRNVECGEIELQLHWIDLPGAKGLQQ